jgi:hypothetical protein
MLWSMVHLSPFCMCCFDSWITLESILRDCQRVDVILCGRMKRLLLDAMSGCNVSLPQTQFEIES